MPVIRRRVVVRGIVQGVGFRFGAAREARRLEVAGWVRNRPDGAVEAELEGPQTAVQAMLDWLGTGPAGAHVDGVDVTETEPLGASGFEIRH
ncbi:acylphosphatase [Agromyces sp. G08B096]|uniref:Acylphosphatase n=1 Tax=Agromyces sp. G08B096 TaxID=3156399 RepID=A0AAU7W4Q9_9MICO